MAFAWRVDWGSNFGQHPPHGQAALVDANHPEETRVVVINGEQLDGFDIETGKPLILYFEATGSGADTYAFLNWLRKQFKKIDIQLVTRVTDYNRFQEKMINGTGQIFQWGWNADYPDPENFLFLLYSKNGKVKFGGENR